MVTNDNLSVAAARLAAYIDQLKKQGKFSCKKRDAGSKHCGAIITDAVLQIGHKYETQVRPCVDRVKKIGKASTISGFLQELTASGASQVLGWNGTKAQMLVIKHAQFFRGKKIDTYAQFHAYLMQESNRDSLIHEDLGVRQKTADYYGVLIRDPNAVKVDSRVSRFLEEVGIIGKYGYKDKREIVRRAAGILNCSPLDLDGSIWAYY